MAMLAMHQGRSPWPSSITGLLLAVGLVALPACKLFRDPDGASSDAYQPPGREDGEFPSFDNATEAILGTRPASDSEAIRALEEAFGAGDYGISLSEATVLKSTAAPASDELDAALFIEGASLYYLGRHGEAQAPLDRQRAEFPDSRYAESAQYYAGSNLVKQMRWRAGGQALDGFLARYPESLLMEFALYDRATTHYALGEYDKCLAMAERLERDFIYSKIKDRAGILRGDVLRRRGDLAQSEAAFLAAKNAAESAGHPKVAARALRNLIEVSGMQKRWRDSMEYYDTFFRKYPKSSQAPAAALAGLPALMEEDKLEEGLDRLEKVLLAMPEGTSARSLNTALRTYSRFYREQYGPEELLKRLGNLSGSVDITGALREQLIVARLEVLETYFPERVAEIRVFYDEMRSRFTRSELATPTVLKIADHVAKTDLDGAIIWYREVLSRPGSQLKAEATLGLAKVLTASGDSGRRAEAEVAFRRVLESYGSPGLQEEAVLGLARLAMRSGNWSEAKGLWERYLAELNWTLARDEARRGLNEASSRPQGEEPRQPPVPPVPPVPREPIPEAKPPVRGAPTVDGAKLQLRLRQAERMIGSGMKAEAFELLKGAVEAGEKIESPDAATSSALRRARILKENLELELGLE